MTTQVALMPMRKTLDTLAETAARLNTKTDELNEVIGDVEHALQDAGVGVTLWLQDLLIDESSKERRFHPQSPGDDRYAADVVRGWELGFAKVDSEWRIAVRYARHEQELASGEWSFFEERPAMPLTKAPRYVRIEAAPLLESLAERLTSKMEAFIKGIAQAKAQAKDSDDRLLELMKVSAARFPTGARWEVSADGLVEIARDAGISLTRLEASWVLERLENDKALEKVDVDGWSFPAGAGR